MAQLTSLHEQLEEVTARRTAAEDELAESKEADERKKQKFMKVVDMAKKLKARVGELESAMTEAGVTVPETE